MNIKNSPQYNSWHWIVYGLIFSSLLHANPSDPTVIQGSASFENIDLQTLSITTGDAAVINWKDFSIDLGELTQFFQPGKHSVVINQVTSDLSSVLLGSLKANGKVFLLNPNGILIGESGRIDTNGFVASTLSASPEDLMNGKMDVLFSGDSTASVVNLGTINAWDGDIILMGYQVDNEGKIFAPNGTAVLGAGQEILLQPLGKDKIAIRLTTQETPDADTGILNTGLITSYEAELKANGNAYALAIKHAGKIDATGIENQNGRVILVAKGGNNGIYGTITAKNADGSFGGDVQILGDHVAILGESVIDVSGALGGGNVNVGGGRNGQDPTVLNGLTTYVDKDTVILANATKSGNGGNVILWADGSTGFYGTISSRGGEQLGDGGFVEVSGKYNLDYKGFTDTRAPYGQTGTLLMDPYDIIIGSSITSGITVTGIIPNLSWTAQTVNPAQVLNTDVTTALGTTNLVVQTSGPGGGGTGSITVNSPLIYTSANLLVLNTNNTGVTSGAIIVNADIQNSGSRGFSLNASGPITFNNVTCTTDQGTLAVDSSGDITLNNTTLSSNGQSGLGIQINAGGAAFIMDATSIVSTDFSANCDLQIVAGTNIVLMPGAQITSGSDHGELILVVDNLFNTVGTQGPGQFIDMGTITSSQKGSVLIYTVQPSQNIVTQPINGATYVPTAPYVDNSENQWLSWFPPATGGIYPFKFFYKNSSNTTTPPFFPPAHKVQEAYNLFNIAAYEFFQRNLDFDVFYYWETLFTSDYDRESYAKIHPHATGYMKFHPYQSMMSSDVFDKMTYGLLRKSYKESNGKITNLLR